MVDQPAYPILKRSLIPLTIRHLGKIDGIERIPKTGAYIMTPNHISRLDPALLSMVVAHYTNRKAHFLTIDYIYHLFEKLRMAKWLGFIKVSKNDRAKSLEDAEQYLKAGGALAIYPEGQMNPSSKLLPGKTGAIRLSLTTGVPIIPVGICGTQSRNTWSALWGLLRHPSDHTFRIGEPYQPELQPGEELNRDSLNRLTFDMMKKIEELCGKPATPRV